MLRSLRKILLFAGVFLAVAFAAIVANQTLQLAEFADRVPGADPSADRRG